MVLRCSFPDVVFSPVQHGVGKVRLRLMFLSLPKVSPRLLFETEESFSPQRGGSRTGFPGSFGVSEHIFY